MAERTCLTIPAGQRLTHSLPCKWEEGDGSTHLATLGSLDWNAVALGEKTIDLEVSLLVKASDPSDPPSVHTIKAKSSGRSFAGRFVPKEEEALLALAEGSTSGSTLELDSIVFEFDNSYSWWTEKEVELITLRTALTENRPPPLPEKAPHSLPPRAKTKEDALEAKEMPPDLRKVEDQACDERSGAFRFIRHLEGMLETAEAQCPKEALRLAGADALWAELLQLRQSCQEALKLQVAPGQVLEKVPAIQDPAVVQVEKEVPEAASQELAEAHGLEEEAKVEE